MNPLLVSALAAGYERIVAWADVLDRINVYPVADGDTGRNLVITLGPLRDVRTEREILIREILLSARGNSGNIAGRFLSGFLGFDDLSTLPSAVETGRDEAYRAVSDPQPGTMLSLFDSMVESLRKHPPEKTGEWTDSVVRDLEKSVESTTGQLRELRVAGVVDSGALGMLVFLDPLLNTLAGRKSRSSHFTGRLRDSFSISGDWEGKDQQGYCFDVAMKVDGTEREVMDRLMAVGDSVVAAPVGGFLKAHFHAKNRHNLRSHLASMGTIVSWAEDDLSEQCLGFRGIGKGQAIHIMTDGAGSITRETANRLEITLLSSYVSVGDHCLPEVYLDPSFLFDAMKRGVKASTSQASSAERQECYHKVLKLHERVLYLCVGSFYTGNYRTAVEWKRANDPDDRMIVLDTGTASGRLGLLARATAEFSCSASDASAVLSFAKEALVHVREYIFLERLHFLAAGGRMSRTGAFFGDLLHIKPIICPFPEGARKMGVARSVEEQVRYGLGRIEKELGTERKATLLLEHTDNREWLEKEIRPEIESRFPLIEVIMQPISLTSAVHMGPGTWGIAFLPEIPGPAG